MLLAYASCAEPRNLQPASDAAPVAAPERRDSGPVAPPAAGLGGLKFCNAIPGAAGVEIQLEIGAVRLSARSGACSPPIGEACASVAAGVHDVSLRTGGGVLLATKLTIEAGSLYTTVAKLESEAPSFAVKKVAGPEACASERLFVEPGQPPPPNTVAAKFCHRLVTATSAALELELVVGTVRLKAVSGGCSTPTGFTCLRLPAGSVTAEVQQAGQVLTRAATSLSVGSEYVFTTRIDANGNPFLDTFIPPLNGTCAAYAY